MTTRIRRRSFIARSNIFVLFVFFVFGGGWVVDGLNSGMYYPSKFDEEKMLRLNEKRIAIETSEIYDDLSGEKGSFFANYYEDEKRGSDVDDLSANAIVEKALEGARVSRESEEGEAISNAIRNVIRDAEMQLQTFLEASSSSSSVKRTAAKTNGPDGNANIWNYERNGDEEVFATPLFPGNEDGGFFEEFFGGGGG